MNKLLFRDEVGLVIVELLEQPLSPVPILVKEKQEVLQVDLTLHRTVGEVPVHQVQDVYFLVWDWMIVGVRMSRIFYRASRLRVTGLFGDTHEPIFILYVAKKTLCCISGESDPSTGCLNWPF